MGDPAGPDPLSEAVAGQGAAAAPEAGGEADTGTGFAKRKNRANIRKRAADESQEQEGEDAGIVRKGKQAKEAPLGFSSRAVAAPKLEVFTFAGNRALQQASDQGATRVLESETAFDRDARALREAVLRQATDGEAAEEGVYKGMNAYTDHRKGFRREHTIAGEKGTGTHGPLRASAHMRVSVRFDYQPDVCKDYKETGYCGFGDSCKFVHDRGDYKSGWEIEREWAAKEKARKEGQWGTEASDDEAKEGDGEEEDELPFACYICRKPWAECEDPVVTRCKHYFCERCALRHNAKSKTCFVCETATGGIFNVAHDIKRKLKADQRKAAEGAA